MFGNVGAAIAVKPMSRSVIISAAAAVPRSMIIRLAHCRSCTRPVIVAPAGSGTCEAPLPSRQRHTPLPAATISHLSEVAASLNTPAPCIWESAGMPAGGAMGRISAGEPGTA